MLEVSKAKIILEDGGIIAYPTEAVWGLGCDPSNREAVQRLLQIKQRPVEKGLVLAAADISQLTAWVDFDAISESQQQHLLKSWPGFQTWIVPAHSSVPAFVKGQHQGVAVRVSAHPVVQQLCQSFGGPIVSTSANPSAQPPARSISEVQAYFGEELDLLVSGELGGADNPSSILDLATGATLR